MLWRAFVRPHPASRPGLPVPDQSTTSIPASSKHSNNRARAAGVSMGAIPPRSILLLSFRFHPPLGLDLSRPATKHSGLVVVVCSEEQKVMDRSIDHITHHFILSLSLLFYLFIMQKKLQIKTSTILYPSCHFDFDLLPHLCFPSQSYSMYYNNLASPSFAHAKTFPSFCLRKPDSLQIAIITAEHDHFGLPTRTSRSRAIN